MPSRLNKRQQREAEELSALAIAPEQEETEDPEEDIESLPATKLKQSAFSLLQAEQATAFDDSSDDQDEDSTSVKKKKKKKKKKTPSRPGSRPGSADPSASPARKSLANSLLKKKEQKDNDDLDKALAELSVKYPDLKNVASTSSAEAARINSTSETLASLLTVSTSHLDSEAELRKFFGSRAVTAAKSESATGSTSHALARNKRLNAQLKSALAHPQPNWWAASQREGLSTRLLDPAEVEQHSDSMGWKGALSEKWSTVEYSKRYKSMTFSFVQAVMAGDPDQFYKLLRTFPWHADTLLQLAEVFRHREEFSQAVDFVERALFTFERAFLGSFSLTTGVNRLVFERVENRPFYLALHRQVTDLHRRGCVRTSFEFARLLYSLDPWSDPHGALLHLDFLAIRAGMSDWLLDLWSFFEGWWSEKEHGVRLSVTFLPGWSYAKALALFVREENSKDSNHDQSDEALRVAMRSFPTIIPLLADKADISIAPSVRSHVSTRILTENSSQYSAPAVFLHMLSHLYAQRSSSLWKTPKRSSWFARIANEEVDKLGTTGQGQRYDTFIRHFTPIEARYGTYRHIMVLESNFKNLFSFFPRQVLDAKQLACDPLPPPNAITQYDPSFFEGVEDIMAFRATSRHQRDRMLGQMVPDPIVLRQLEGFFNAHPQLAQQFPGGLVEFLHVVGQMDEAELADLMIQQAAGHDGDGAMPGHLNFDDVNAVPIPQQQQNVEPEVHTEDEEQPEGGESEDSELDEPVPPMPVRILRNVMGLFTWGGAGNRVEEETSDDE